MRNRALDRNDLIVLFGKLDLEVVIDDRNGCATVPGLGLLITFDRKDPRYRISRVTYRDSFRWKCDSMTAYAYENGDIFVKMYDLENEVCGSFTVKGKDLS